MSSTRNSNVELLAVLVDWDDEEEGEYRFLVDEFKELRRLRQNIYVVTHPLFDQALFIKLAQFPWQIPFFEAETTAYEWIVNQGVGPKFIAHLTEAGRVIGFVLEYIEGARSADVGDLVACQDSLAQLHSLGIKHGDINK
ncbi:hypothetical protein TrVFT333_004180 [Trichoderma virens FT-333]|nr:hypothetical protein TrVFT333_004180 [Trichoderma virens FT-333]